MIHSSTHPYTHKAIPQYDPGQEKDKGFVTAEEGRYIGAVDLSQSLKVQVVCHNPQQAERGHFSEEHLCRQSIVSEEPTALSEIPQRQKIN